MTDSMNTTSKSTNILLLIGILCIAINLRPAIAGVGPLVDDIKLDTGLSNAMLGLLTTLPLIAFGVISMLTPLFTNRFGIGKTLFGAMILLIIGILIRYIEGNFFLYFGTLLFGISIAFGNVLLPGITKRNFSENSGLVTSLYSAVMAVGASLAAGVSVPLTHIKGVGWRGSLVVWALLAFIAALIWFPQVNRLKKPPIKNDFIKAMKSLTKSRLAWQVAIFMGLQSLTFYVILAWLPAILISRGFDADYAGWMLSLSQATGILASLIVPIIAGKRKDQRSIVLVLILMEIVGIIGLMLPQFGGVAIWVSLIGFVLGGSFGLSLLFIVLRSHDTASATELSGMAQSIGYIIAATGPFIFASIFDFTGSWVYALILLLVVSVLKLFSGLYIGKPGEV
ncbi:CynX/NimT family MFS transporter [Aureibaculum luteum]|uniref:CynX/NimT family MFS transporter n=1 Tax=Aureibaculum luteum TaxID=1548456 RepID=UPI000E49EBEF|nr:MFS transporter [Aureibaculum luteum]